MQVLQAAVPVSSWYSPAGHGSGVERPAVQRLPTVHGVAAVPLPGQKKPAGHGCDGVMVLAFGQVKPAVQSEHPEMSVFSTACVNVPSGQRIGAAVPPGQ